VICERPESDAYLG